MLQVAFRLISARANPAARKAEYDGETRHSLTESVKFPTL
jgi:hypothetical protein